ncbi:Noc2p family protein [Babesia bovis T2Bo]|uniref:Nucleolar complex protein 2 homolog n=1 Tax=Babesia bovis TaxID=5865 RepID=A7ARQ9_BABBO|nr:Noc2p family protein [Babesia bovis T2Bo]EDO07228.1 Noc2p family protein [Babesia bovis T2Bo]|eukprot:XP_001610796.1 hypothetical protein [Babesia bovis T2Bo]
MDTNILISGKRRKARGTVARRGKKHCATDKRKQKEPKLKNDKKVPDDSDNDSISAASESDGIVEGSDASDISDYSSDSNISDYDIDDISDDDDDEDTDDLEFNDEEMSDYDIEDEVEDKCKVISAEMADTILENSKQMNESDIKRLVKVYCSIIRREALKHAPEEGPKEKTADKKKKDDAQRHNRKSFSSRSMFSNLHKMVNKYHAENHDVYSYIIMQSQDLMAQYLASHELSFKNKEIADVALLFRQFLSASLLQLGISDNDVDITKSILGMICNHKIMPWIACLKYLQKALVKVTSSLLTYHKESVIRVLSLQVLIRYLESVKESNFHKIQIYHSAGAILKVERLSSQEAKKFCSDSLHFLMTRCYRTLVSAGCVERNLKNFTLFKMSQNCVAELFSHAPEAAIYIFAFKSIRDLAINVRREWMALNDRKKRDKKTPKKSESHGMVLPVYSWGFVDAINLWVSTLARCKKHLIPLSYPLVTVILGAIKIRLPHIAYMPYILHMITALNQLSDGIQRFIPLCSILFNLLEQLKNHDVAKLKRREARESKKMLDNANDLMVMLKFSKKQLHASDTYKVLYRHVGLVLTDHIGLLSLHPSFPEFTIPVVAFLQKYVKSNRVDHAFRSQCSKLVSMIDQSATVIREKREKIDLEKRQSMNLKVFESESKQIPIYCYRMEQLLRYQQINKEKVEGTLLAAKL